MVKKKKSLVAFLLIFLPSLTPQISGGCGTVATFLVPLAGIRKGNAGPSFQRIIVVHFDLSGSFLRYQFGICFVPIEILSGLELLPK